MEDILAGKKSVAGLASHLTRRVDNLNALVSDLTRGKDSVWLREELSKGSKDLNQRVVEVALAYEQLSVDDVAHANIYAERSAHYISIVDAALAGMRSAYPKDPVAVVPKWDPASVVAPVAVAGVQTRTLDLKNAEILFPKEPLSAEATLQDLRDWMEKFEAFFATANAELAPGQTQRRLLLQAMDPTLAEYLRISCPKEKPVYGTAGMMEALQARFLELNPRFKRLREILTAEQPSGMTFSVWMTKLENASREAKLDTVTDEDLLCFALMSSCRDQRLKAKLLKFAVPTVAKLRTEVVAYEVVNRNETLTTQH